MERTNMFTWPHDWAANGDWDWAVAIWAKNFRQEERQEILVCDLSCAVGEVGGNLGLFLGGSVLMYVDSLINLGGGVVRRVVGVKKRSGGFCNDPR